MSLLCTPFALLWFLVARVQYIIVFDTDTFNKTLQLWKLRLVVVLIRRAVRFFRLLDARLYHNDMVSFVCTNHRTAVGLKMLLVLCVVVSAVRSYCHANEIFPEALVFEELGLTDMVANKSVATDDRNDTATLAGNLNDALMTMNFHRCVHRVLVSN